ncbi:TIGR03943 family putative permease subunit [Streptomyces avermitilis]|uniref:TIGR03943 family putative permease subunit n=1 Tax=Streptomyces avermitilis TaxID=33903 RepID=UPI0037FCF461
MNRQAQAVVLFLVGGAVLRAGSTDLYLRYVKAGLRPLLLAAGAVLIVAAVATVWYEIRRPRGEQHDAHEDSHGPDHDHGPDHGPDHGHNHGHGHAHRESWISWLLVLPLFALILVAPPALGSYSAVRTGTALQAPWGFPTLPSGDPLKLSVDDYAGRAAFDHGRSLKGRKVTITGFIALDRSGAPYLTRMILSCCAADAQPIKVGLTGRTPPVLQPDTWLEITGTYSGRRTKDPVNNGVIPFIDVSRATPVPAPRDQYESPE